jgi:hypothetical protein
MPYIATNPPREARLRHCGIRRWLRAGGSIDNTVDTMRQQRPTYARARDIHTGDAQPHRDARSMKPTVELQRPETPLHVRYMPLSTHLTWASRGPITLCHTSHNHLYSLRAGGGGSATSTVYRFARLPPSSPHAANVYRSCESPPNPRRALPVRPQPCAHPHIWLTPLSHRPPLLSPRRSPA